MTHQKPPPGYVFVEDFEADDGTVTAGIATRLGISASAYKKWRMAGKGPLYRKHGKRIIARPEWVEEWQRAQDDVAFRPRPEMRPPEPKLKRKES
ncbi:hypothetical protein [Streptomyces sp. NPDC088733]|uniref:hypothetical protein n=1 Tax=Streptomyces sp. NPDC088733 TaxID=3365880 RepID=UPI0037FC4E64